MNLTSKPSNAEDEPHPMEGKKANYKTIGTMQLIYIKLKNI